MYIVCKTVTVWEYVCTLCVRLWQSESTYVHCRWGCVPGGSHQWGEWCCGTVQACPDLHPLHGHTVPHRTRLTPKPAHGWACPLDRIPSQQDCQHGLPDYTGEFRLLACATTAVCLSWHSINEASPLTKAVRHGGYILNANHVSCEGNKV